MEGPGPHREVQAETWGRRSRDEKRTVGRTRRRDSWLCSRQGQTQALDPARACPAPGGLLGVRGVPGTSFERRRRDGAEMRVHPGGSGPCPSEQGGTRADACAVTARLGEQTVPRCPQAMGEESQTRKLQCGGGHRSPRQPQAGAPRPVAGGTLFSRSLGRKTEPASTQKVAAQTGSMSRREDGHAHSGHHG